MDVEEKIRNFVTMEFLFGDGSELKDDASLSSSGVLDSTGILTLVNFVENEFNIILEDSEIVPDNMDTVVGIVKLVKIKMSK